MAKNPPQPRRVSMDPLEAVRLRDPELAPQHTEAAPEVAVEACEPAFNPAEVPEPVKSSPAASYRVTAMSRVCIGGQVSIVKIGKIYSEATHGPGIIEHLQKAGVPLELITR